MAAEYSAVGTQNVNAGQPILFTEARVPCTKGLVFHQNGSGVFLLANNIPSCLRYTCRGRFYETLYDVEVNGNVSIPEGGTVGEILLQVVVDGEPDPIGLIRITPAAADQFVHFSTSLIVAVPGVCRCSNVSFRNVSTAVPTVVVENPSIKFDPVGYQQIVQC